MRYIKILGLLTVAAASLMALAGTASATTITSPTGTTYTGELTATSTNTKIDGAFVTIECGHSHWQGPITQHGAGLTVKGTFSTKSLTNCNYPVKVEATGTFEIHAIKKNNVGPHETCGVGVNNYCYGTLTSSGTKWTIETSVGNCVFTTTNTGLGTITGTDATGGSAVVHTSAVIPRTGGSFLCGSSGTLTGNYTISTPAGLWIDE